MTPEQIERLQTAIADIINSCKETEAMISDYSKCESEISKKYLGAAIKKQASSITSHMPADMFA